MDEGRIRYVKTSVARSIYKVTDGTLRKWAKEGKVKTIRNPGGHRLYEVKDNISNDSSVPDALKNRKICYCRVSSSKQKDDLERQVESMRTGFPEYHIISDIGSGINWNRKGLKTILERTMRGELDEVVVSHRDRLCRFGFELVEWIMDKNKVKLVVLNRENGSSETELAADVLAIIHVFSCKQMGRRRYKPKEIESRTCLNDDDTTEISTISTGGGGFPNERTS